MIHCFYIMVKLILNALNIFLTLNPNWFQFISKRKLYLRTKYKLKLMGFRLKTNINI